MLLLIIIYALLTSKMREYSWGKWPEFESGSFLILWYWIGFISNLISVNVKIGVITLTLERLNKISPLTVLVF